jgi:hypothetical protein
VLCNSLATGGLERHGVPRVKPTGTSQLAVSPLLYVRCDAASLVAVGAGECCRVLTG